MTDKETLTLDSAAERVAHAKRHLLLSTGLLEPGDKAAYYLMIPILRELIKEAKKER